MKKGSKLREIGYFLEIKDLRNRNWVTPSACRSLREAVEEAAQEVQDMDNYLKVYRECKASNGVYISTFFSIPTEAHPAKQVIVQITAYELLTSQEITDALEYIERISKNEKHSLYS